MQYYNFPKEYLTNAFPELVRHLSVLQSVAQVPFESIFLNFLMYANHPAQILYRAGVRKASNMSSSSLFALLVAHSGERKSTIDGFFSKALTDLSTTFNNIYKAEEKEEKQRKMTCKINNTVYLEKDIKQPGIIGSAPTVEGVRKGIGLGYHFYSIFSSEGGTFFAGYANNKDNHLKTLAELSGFKDGAFKAEVRVSELSREKINNGDIIGAKTAISFSMFLSQQPTVFSKLMSGDAALAQGFLGRCLLLTPKSFAGTRSLADWIPECEKNAAIKYINDNFDLQYKEVKRNTAETKYKKMYFRDESFSEYKKIWEFFEPYCSHDNIISEGATFCNRRTEHVLSIATTLQSFRLNGDHRADEVYIDEDIFELSWRLFQYFYGQFIHSIKPYFQPRTNRPLLFDTEKFLNYLKKALKKQHRTEDESIFDNLEFTISTRMFLGVSRIYTNQENIKKQIACLLNNKYLEATSDKNTFKFINLHPTDHDEVFPDYWNQKQDYNDTKEAPVKYNKEEFDQLAKQETTEQFFNMTNNLNIPSHTFDKEASQAHKENVKSRINLKEVAKKYFTLERDKILCPFHTETTPSCHVYKDSYHCYGCESHGDIFDFLQQITGQGFKEILTQLENDCGITPEANLLNIKTEDWREIREQEQEIQRLKNLKYAVSVYKASKPLNNDSCIYLQNRVGKYSYANTASRLEQIRGIDSHKYSETGTCYPVMLWPIRAESGTGSFIGCHLTFLNSDCSAKADVSPNKKIIGSHKGGAIKIRQSLSENPNQQLIIAEGIETAISALIHLEFKNLGKEYDCIAAINAANLAAQDTLTLKQKYSKIIIAADNDETGLRYANELNNKLKLAGVVTELIIPPKEYKDFNDLLTGKKNEKTL